MKYNHYENRKKGNRIALLIIALIIGIVLIQPANALSVNNTIDFEDIITTIETEIDTSLCGGDTLFIGGEIYTEAGVYILVLTGSTGQDSLVKINIEYLGDSYEIFIDTAMCNNSMIVIGDVVYENPGEYKQELESIAGCDSTLIIKIGLKDIGGMSHIDTIICELIEGLTIGNETYFTPGIHQQFYQMGDECDSIVTIIITLDEDVATSVIDAKICDGVSITIGNITYDTAGTYYQIFEKENECDSLLIINLISVNIPETIIDTTICENTTVVIGGITYDAPGDYTQTITTASGCDSTILIHIETKICNFDDCEDALFEIRTNPTLHICPGQPNPYVSKMQAACQFEYYNLTVVNILGQVVFRSLTPGDFWNGYTQFKSPFEFYYYVLYYRLPGGPLQMISGIIVIVC